MLFLTVLRDGNEEQRCGAHADEELSLVSAAASGDRPAFERLVEKYAPFVCRTVFYSVGNSADAEDLTQEIFLKVWRGLPDFGGRSQFLTWLTRIARNTCTDYIRKKQRSPKTEPLMFAVSDDGEESEIPIQDTDPARDPTTAAERKEDAFLLRQAMCRLSEEHRTLILLRDLEGYSYEQIAGMLGIEVGTVKSRLSRARAKLREMLAAYGMFD